MKSLHGVQAHSFASDNYSGIAPKVLAALTAGTRQRTRMHGALAMSTARSFRKDKAT